MNEPLMVTPREAADMLSIGMRDLYALVTNGSLDRRYIGKGTTRYRITVASLHRYVEGLPTEPVSS